MRRLTSSKPESLAAQRVAAVEDTVAIVKRVRRLMLASVCATGLIVLCGLMLLEYNFEAKQIDPGTISTTARERMLVERVIAEAAALGTSVDADARGASDNLIQSLHAVRAERKRTETGAAVGGTKVDQSSDRLAQLDALAAETLANSDTLKATDVQAILVAGRGALERIDQVAESVAHNRIDAGKAGRVTAVLIGSLVIFVLAAKWRLIYRPAVTLLSTRTGNLAAREAEAYRLAEIARRTSNAVVVCNIRGEVEWVNEAFERITGYAAEEAIGHRPGKLLQGPGTDLEQVARIHEAVVKQEQVLVELQNYTKSGTPYWIRIEIEPLVDDCGAVTGFMAIESEFTQEHQAREALRDAEAFLRRTLDAMDAHIAILDDQGVIVTVNAAWRRFAVANGGGSASCCEGANYFGVCAAIANDPSSCSDAERVAEAIRLALASDGPVPVIQYACHSATEQRWFNINIQGFECNGRRFAVIAHQNETAVVVARAQMRTEHERLVAFVDSAPAAIAMFDRDMRYITASRRWHTLHGVEGRDLVGQSHYDIVPNLPSHWRDIHARCLAGAIESSEDEIWRPVGSDTDRHLQWEARPWTNAKGEIEGILIFAKDTTRERQREADLARLREEAEQASHAKSAFLANMSHEIRTPLTAILGYTDLLEETGDLSKAPSERLGTIATIRGAGAHLLNVVNDILDISKIEAGQLNIERVETSLPDILNSVEAINAARASAKGVALSFEISPLVPDRVLTDPTRIRQLAMNLVGNAVKFTEHGSVTVRLSAAPSNNDTMLTLVVEDTGPGMNAEQSSRLFKSFSQADDTVTRRHGGTGLGLVISRTIANMMGGDVELTRSEPGKGSVFTATVVVGHVTGAGACQPVKARAATTPAPVVNSNPKLLSGRILLAEDGPDNQRLISFHLRKAGASVDVADNGRIALDMLEKADAEGNPYDLLVTDMQMPEMDGYTLAATLRACGSTLPIIALTAHAMAGDRTRCLEAGCDDYATKPIDRGTLIGICAARISAARNSEDIHPSGLRHVA